ncbi:hypothetical protein OBO34_22305 [Clostridiales Family XIII bacterium ASD5510]|uniref:Uncharacterized protein n=1 Tax=Hominibacterium faecale TaxID=2839743 RepID=A0A9J6QZU1_9FIRM|nr:MULTISPECIES: hypothetical protein [Bacteria]MCU7381051.1 hypothetical protein [Hominibacterium faecale]
MIQTDNKGWLANVEIKDAIDGQAQVYIDGRLVPGVIGYKVEQNSQDKRVPVLDLQVQCNFDMASGAIPLLPEPWTWFYKPISDNFTDERDHFESLESDEG